MTRSVRLIFFCLLTFSFRLFGQSPVDLMPLFEVRKVYQQAAIVNQQQLETGYIDAIYFDTLFMRGNVKLSGDNKTYNNLSIRYNILFNDLEIETGKKKGILPSDKIESFTIYNQNNDSTFFLKKKLIPSLSMMQGGDFINLVLNGEVPLYRFYQIKIIKANYNVQLNVGSKIDTFKKEIYFYTVINGTAKLVPDSQKKFLKLFDNDVLLKNKVEKFFKSNNIDLKNQNHLLLLFMAING